VSARNTCDPVTLEIVKGALRSTQAEMEALIERTAMSAFIREKKDFFAALFDGDGRLVVGSAIPIFGDIIGPIYQHYRREDVRPGDIYWYNDCYLSKGAVSHSPDQVFVLPVFAEGRIVAYAQSWAHFNDIGGMRPGSLSPDCTDIYQEGIMVPPVRVARAGELNDEALRIFFRNSRFPQMVQGDTRASIAAVRLGERRMTELFLRFGAALVEDAFRQLLARTEAVTRSKLRQIFPDGTHRFTEPVDSDGQGHGPFHIRFNLTSDNGRLSLDASETDDQSPGPINFLMPESVPRAIFGMYTLVGEPGAMLNAGVENAIDSVVARPGSLLQPMFPAPLGQRGLTLMRTIYACMGLVNVATKGEGPAGAPAYVIYYLRGLDAHGQPFLMTDGVGVGYGARPFADGIDAVYFVAQENYPAEFLDLSYPVRLCKYTLNPDSGGPGKFRGGCGVIREIEMLGEEARVSMRIDSVVNPPWGVRGGHSGRSGRAILNPGRNDEREVPAISDSVILRQGDVLRLETGGGGGWGHPFDRDAARVLADVLGGMVSRDSAERDYGVVIQDDKVDEHTTRELRAHRGPSKLFHRGEYVDELV
jgi:N-methylhydantoinase B